MSFIAHCIEQIAASGLDTTRFQVIVPSQRAAFEVRRLWCNRFEPPVLLPEIFTLEQWAVQYAGSRPVSRIEWIYVCHQVMQSMGLVVEDFLSFYPLGKVLSYDFEDLITHRLSFDRVYGILRDRAKVEVTFAEFLSQDQINYLQLFFEGFEEQSESQYKQRFADLYGRMAEVFTRVQTVLEQRQACTQGMALQRLAELLTSEDGASMHYYCIAPLGFPPVIAPVIQQLMQSGRCTVLGYAPAFGADSPVSFINMPNALSKLIAAGAKHLEEAAKVNTQQALLQKPKLYIVPASGRAGQRQMMGQLLQQIFSANPEAKVHAIIPEQQLLAEFRDHVPQSVPSTSSFAYAFTESMMYDWLKKLLSIAEHRAPGQSQFVVSTRQLLAFLRHPANIGVPMLKEWLQALVLDVPATKSNRIMVELTDTRAAAHQVFEKVAAQLSLQDLRQIIERFILYNVPYLAASIRQREEVLAHQLCNSMNEIFLFADKQASYSAAVMSTGLGYLFFNTAVQTTGSYDAQLVVGGIESGHAFPAETVLIAGLNYGVLPGKPDLQSYIPANIRKAFGLPTAEEVNAFESFHFYNTVFTAKEVYLLHSEGAAGAGRDEISPLLWQLELLTEAGAAATLIKPDIPRSNSITHAIEIAKTPEVLSQIEALFFPTDGRQSRKVSPSMLSTYLQCALKFYYAYVQGLREEALFFEPLRENELGTAYHKVMELLYLPFVDIAIDAATIEGLLPQVDLLVQQAIEETILQSGKDDTAQPSEGLLLIYAATLREWVKNTLIHDKAHAPFTVKGLELTNRWIEVPLADGRNLICGGSIDRLQQNADGSWWVVDYKTGSPNNIKPKYEDVALLFDGNKKNDYPLQGLLYALMVYKHQHIAINDPINARIIAVKKLAADFTISQPKTTVEDNGRLEELYSLVQAHLNKIFDPQEPFNQTDRIENCTICSFNTFCRRV